MNHYHYLATLSTLWHDATSRYQKGAHKAETLFSSQEDQDFIRSIGATPQEIFDFIEDYISGGEPDFATFAVLQDIRRSYFLEVQGGVFSSMRLVPSLLPARDEELAGIRWLPRIIPKAMAKLRGELDPDIMYCCGGDRRFFKENNIHPGDFLRVVWRSGGNREQIAQWVVKRSTGN